MLAGGLAEGAIGWATDVCVPISRLAECITETKADLEQATGRLVLIDLPQIVDVVTNPQGGEFLARDVRNVARWFSARGLTVDADDLIDRLCAEAGLR